MVRLRGGIRGQTQILIHLFQFQDGAIKGINSNGDINPKSNIFQFQDGAIKGLSPPEAKGFYQYISIPRWCD